MAKKRNESDTQEMVDGPPIGTLESVQGNNVTASDEFDVSPPVRVKRKKSARNATLRYYVAEVANDMTMTTPLSVHFTMRRAIKSLETLIGPREVGIYKVVRVA